MDYQPTFGFQKREQQIALRKALLAKLIKDQMRQPDMPKGEMVSGIYVRPSPFQALSAAAQPYMQRNEIERTTETLGNESAEYEAADRAAAMAHARARPRGTPELQGPVDQNNPTELYAKEPDPAALTNWAQEGTNIPSRRAVMTKLLEDMEVEEPVRQVARGEKRLDREDRQAEARAALRSKEEEAERARIEKGEQQAADRVEAARRDKQASDDRRFSTTENNETRRQMIQALADRAEAAAKAKVDAAKAGRAKLSDKARADLDAFEASNNGMASAIAALEKASDKGTGYLPGLIQDKLPGGAALVAKQRTEATNNAIQQLTYWTDAIRHDRFGAALTAGEKASAAQYLPSEYDSLADIKRKAKGLQGLLDLNHRKLRAQAGEIEASTNQKRLKFNPATGQVE